MMSPGLISGAFNYGTKKLIDMENLDELHDAIKKAEQISFILEGKLDFDGRYMPNNDYVQWYHKKKKSFTSFGTIAKLIGEEKLLQFTGEFEAKLRGELLKVQDEREKELAKYSIVKDE